MDEHIEGPKGKIAQAYEALRSEGSDLSNGERLERLAGDVPTDELTTAINAGVAAFVEFATDAATNGHDPEEAVRGGIASVLLLGMELGAQLAKAQADAVSN